MVPVCCAGAITWLFENRCDKCFVQVFDNLYSINALLLAPWVVTFCDKELILIGSTIVQRMHFVCSVQNHYMKQWWFILKWILGIKLLQAYVAKLFSKCRLSIDSPLCIESNELNEAIIICKEN